MLRVLLLTGIIASVSSLSGQTSSPSAAPSLEQRVADLEAYVTNSPRGVDIGSASSSNIAAPGPSYNAWMMMCTALVLFVTLPRLALFYGGLVRAKNVLSVLAQCLGIAGLVTILWWTVGYSVVF
jgi:Amt family ammonium transporter